MRVVLTPQGLDLSFRLKAEIESHQRQKSVNPPPRPKSMLGSRLSTARPGRRFVPTAPNLPLSGISPYRSPKNPAKIKKRYEVVQAQRQAIMRRIHQKLEAARERRQTCVLSYLDLDTSRLTPEPDRAAYLHQLHEIQDTKYSKAWRWLDSKGFCNPKRPVSARLN